MANTLVFEVYDHNLNIKKTSDSDCDHIRIESLQQYSSKFWTGSVENGCDGSVSMSRKEY